MGDYSENDRQKAERYIRLLTERGGNLSGEIEEGLSVIDVQDAVEQFEDELDFVRSAGKGFPAVLIDDGPPVPVSLASFGDMRWGNPHYRPGLPSDLFREWYAKTPNGLPGLQPSAKFMFVPPEEASQCFASRATTFLATRLAGIRAWIEGGRDPYRTVRWNTVSLPQHRHGPPLQMAGCTFSVSTNTSNLSVYWSGAYYLSSNFFGHPTSPATSTLLAGTYIFGVAGGTYSSVQWDTNAACSLPGIPKVHLNY